MSVPARRPSIRVPKVHRGLYGRVALGYILLIAIELAAQGALFLWLSNRSASSEAGWSDVTRAASARIARALTDNPEAAIEPLIERHEPPALFVILLDGRLFGTRPDPSIERLVVHEFSRPGIDTTPLSWENGPYHGVPLVVRGHLKGVVSVAPPTAFQRFGRVMIVGGALIFVAGIICAALVIGGPVRRRLRDIESVARRVGDGDLDARAPVDGGDELAEFAETFNEMADRLDEHTRALEASDRARRQLIADVSHELMTPLTAILGHLETLTMTEVRLDDQKRQHAIAVTMREAQRLERLIGELLDAARLEAGGGDLQIQPVGVADLFEQVIAHHEHDSRARNVRFTSSIASDVHTVPGDPFRLEQALENVTANALRHTPDGGVIALDAQTGDGVVVLTVSDSGAGIAPEHLPQIFDRFYKTGSAKGLASTGTGLGLSIVKAIVARHAGKIRAESELGHGTTIRIELPVVDTSWT